jgi:hypothetical protein
MDVASAPDFATSGQIDLSFAKAGEGGELAALGCGRLTDGRIENFTVILRPKSQGIYFGLSPNET